MWPVRLHKPKLEDTGRFAVILVDRKSRSIELEWYDTQHAASTDATEQAKANDGGDVYVVKLVLQNGRGGGR